MVCWRAQEPQHLREHQEMREKIYAWLKAQERSAAYLARRVGYTDPYVAAVLWHRHCCTDAFIKKSEQCTGLMLR